jgi:carboxypeptidase family protein
MISASKTPEGHHMQHFRTLHLGVAATRTRSLSSSKKRASVYCGSIVVFAFCILSSMCFAQDITSSIRLNDELPDAPGRAADGQSRQQSPALEAHAILSGTVADINGSAVPDSRVTLIGNDASGKRVTVSDSLGRFTFTDLPAGTFHLTIVSAGLRNFTSDAIVLSAGESRELPPTALPIASTNTEVQVFASSVQVAQAQVKLAEKQRVMGIIPNFYSSYIWDAAPLTTKLKFDLALRSTTDPVAFLLAAGVAGVEQSHNTFPGYGSGLGGYGKRYGAAYADNVIGRMIGSAILPSIFHQDPRYFYKGKGGVKSRALYAVGATFIARGDNGHLQPNYSHILGNFAAAGISNLYRASGDRSATLTIRNGFIITGTNAIGNLAREFLLKRLTSKVPAFAQGQP